MRRIFLFLYVGTLLFLKTKAMDTHAQSLDKATILYASEQAKAVIPSIMKTPSFKVSFKKDLHVFCTQAEELLLNESLRTTFWHTHQTLKDLMPEQTYCFVALYRIYFNALQKAHEKSWFDQIAQKNAFFVELIRQEEHENKQTLALTKPANVQ